MAVFQSKKFRSSADANKIASRYRALLAKHPFLLFGLPFIATMVAGSFFLTPATAIRYEKHDRRVRRLSKEEELGIGKAGRKVDMKEEYYRLAAKDLDDWEQKRVKRLPGEHDGVI
ncbi:Cytochrome oxidase assembly [Mollisiaceae sp. DMI_Dod_QoI]|nr:Cytochrome oxidase assembly [Helotiales sp. DMI_Dod_QoI]